MTEEEKIRQNTCLVPLCLDFLYVRLFMCHCSLILISFWIVNEKQDVIKAENNPGVDVPQTLDESKIIRDIYNPENMTINQKDNIGDRSKANKKLKLFENEGENEKIESDYCGIRETDFDKLSALHLAENHENFWSIFQNSNIFIPLDLVSN